jgi:Tfp pilus assembly protein PilO
MGLQSTRLIVAMVAVAALAVGFWILLVAPKRQEASDLGTTVSHLKASLASERQQVSEALAARRGFPEDYQQLVVLGKAVPGDDETASLLVSLEHIAAKAHVSFREISLETSGSEGSETTEAVPAAPVETPPSSSSTPASVPVPAAPTEVAAATLPLGASVGPAGLDVMPYKLRFIGDFSHVADFIQGLDSLVKTHNAKVAVDGRLITVDGFSLSSVDIAPFPVLEANFAVTTYLTPPDQGVTGGATPVAPSPVTATPASTTTGGTP